MFNLIFFFLQENFVGLEDLNDNILVGSLRNSYKHI